MMSEKLKYDGSLDLATGRSRKETNWRNKEWLWSDLLDKLSTTHCTAETHGEYMAAKKPRQDEIKDIGGFVGGYINGGRRKSGSILHRQLLTLDIDFCKGDFWSDLEMMYSNAACMYSTHKHCPESPRLRLLMPLSRPVASDEYEAIARKVAGDLDIELFDPTTFQPERLMYWPSTSKGGEYLYQVQDGCWLDADDVLNSYHDWRDSSAWPVSSRVDKILQRNILKQGDPLEKKGVVGAFCRTYSIQEAIEKFLSSTYAACDIENRFTYLEGSTAAGLVVYDDKYAYSHHGTDPTSGKLCNAFDLVRIHKFGLKDEDSREGVASNNLPSYTAMVEFCTKDDGVKKQIGAEKMRNAKSDFEDIDNDTAEEINDDWLTLLQTDGKGNYLSTIDNIYIVLQNDAKLRKAFYFDEFEARHMIRRNLPWRKVDTTSKDFNDMDFDCLSHYLERDCKMPFNQLQKALSRIMADYKIHPVREYLSAQKWDGEQRLETLLIDYLGAEDSLYTRAATRKTFIAAAARIFEPGTKFDTVLTLVGKQGTGKSTIIDKMANGWFSDNLGDVHKKEGAESIRGVWLMEIAEMASLKKADQESIKKFITCREDMYRPSYGKYNIRFPRQCVFIGTTNREDFLSDPTGNRRFLPVKTSICTPTKNIFKDLDKNEIGQLWAEAVSYYKAGESIDLSESIKVIAEQVREAHTVYDERTGMIIKYLETLLPENWDTMAVYDRRGYISGDEFQAEGTVERTTVCVAEIWCEVLGGFQKDMTTHNTKFIHDIMRNLKGWTAISVVIFKPYGKQRGYRKTATPKNSVATKKATQATPATLNI